MARGHVHRDGFPRHVTDRRSRIDHRSSRHASGTRWQKPRAQNDDNIICTFSPAWNWTTENGRRRQDEGAAMTGRVSRQHYTRARGDDAQVARGDRPDRDDSTTFIVRVTQIFVLSYIIVVIIISFPGREIFGFFFFPIHFTSSRSFQSPVVLLLRDNGDRFSFYKNVSSYVYMYDILILLYVCARPVLYERARRPYRFFRTHKRKPIITKRYNYGRLVYL